MISHKLNMASTTRIRSRFGEFRVRWDDFLRIEVGSKRRLTDASIMA